LTAARTEDGSTSRCRRPQQCPRCRHHHCGWHALVGDIGDDDAYAFVGQVDEVIEVTSHFAGRSVAHLHLPAGHSGQLVWKEVVLDQTGDLELLRIALSLPGFLLLLADELSDSDRRRRLSGERVEQLEIVP
jgi:hypothetical protein